MIPANEEINWNKHRYEPCEDDFVCAAVQGGGLEGSGPEGSGSGAEDNTCPEVDIPINKYVKNICSPGEYCALIEDCSLRDEWNRGNYYSNKDNLCEAGISNSVEGKPGNPRKCLIKSKCLN